MVITLSGSVLFASNQSVLLPEAQTRLNQVADALMQSKERTILIEGHTDSRGSASTNMALSQRRAESGDDQNVNLAPTLASRASRMPVGVCHAGP